MLIYALYLQKADLAVGDITITEDRKKVVDFSVPFMSLGISILYTKEKEVPPGWFSFLNPYTFEMWMYTATAYCVVSILLFVCSRYYCILMIMEYLMKFNDVSLNLHVLFTVINKYRFLFKFLNCGLIPYPVEVFFSGFHQMIGKTRSLATKTLKS